jgi:hypothetical protein
MIGSQTGATRVTRRGRTGKTIRKEHCLLPTLSPTSQKCTQNLVQGIRIKDDMDDGVKFWWNGDSWTEIIIKGIGLSSKELVGDTAFDDGLFELQ